MGVDFDEKYGGKEGDVKEKEKENERERKWKLFACRQVRVTSCAIAKVKVMQLKVEITGWRFYDNGRE